MAKVNNFWLWLGHGLDIHWQMFIEMSQVLLRTLRIHCCSERDTVPAVLALMVWRESQALMAEWSWMEPRTVKDKRRGSVRAFNKETRPRLEGQGGTPKWWLNRCLCEEGQAEGRRVRAAGTAFAKALREEHAWVCGAERRVWSWAGSQDTTLIRWWESVSDWDQSVSV